VARREDTAWCSGHHVIHISQWLELELGGGNLFTVRFWNMNYFLDKGRTERVG
jgi:hypothetical protein